MDRGRQSSVMGNVKAAQNRHQRPPGAGLEIRLLGPMTVHIDGNAVTIASKRVRALLAYLVQREGIAIPRTTLAGLLWGEREETQARASLRQSLSELRAALGEASDKLAADKESVTWQPDAAWADTRALETAMRTEDMTALAEAALLARGELIEGLSLDEPGFDQWLTGERERLRMLIVTLHTRLMKWAEQERKFEEAINHGLKLLSLDPLQETVHRTLMRLYSAQGRPDAALAQYERCERELASELGIRPDAETEALARSIRTQRRETAAKPKPAQPMPEKTAITVLPFANLSSERDHGYFAEGLTQDIIAALSQAGGLLVVTSAGMQTAEKKTDFAGELGVRFVLEGSVRAAGSRIRVTSHLIDGLSGQHIWAERFEGDLGEIFAVQDQITQAIALAMQVKLTHGDMARFWEGQTRNLRAWEKMVAARQAFQRFNPADNAHARRLLEDAIQIDPAFTGAMVLHGMTHWWDARCNKDIAPDLSLRLAEADYHKALGLKPDLGIGYMLKGGIAWLRDEHDEAIACARQAVDLAPSDTHSVAFLAMLYMYAGDCETSIATLTYAMRLCPQYPTWYVYYMAWNHLWSDNIPVALEYADLYLRQEPDEPYAFALMAAIRGFQGRKKDAAAMIARLHERSPNFGLTEIRMSQHYRERAKFDKLAGVLREAGLPD